MQNFRALTVREVPNPRAPPLQTDYVKTRYRRRFNKNRYLYLEPGNFGNIEVFIQKKLVQINAFLTTKVNPIYFGK